MKTSWTLLLIVQMILKFFKSWKYLCSTTSELFTKTCHKNMYCIFCMPLSFSVHAIFSIILTFSVLYVMMNRGFLVLVLSVLLAYFGCIQLSFWKTLLILSIICSSENIYTASWLVSFGMQVCWEAENNITAS